VNQVWLRLTGAGVQRAVAGRTTVNPAVNWG
jgi:hypothetical protein